MHFDAGIFQFGGERTIGEKKDLGLKTGVVEGENKVKQCDCPATHFRGVIDEEDARALAILVARIGCRLRCPFASFRDRLGHAGSWNCAAPNAKWCVNVPRGRDSGHRPNRECHA